MAQLLLALAGLAALAWLGTLAMYAYLWAKYGEWAPMTVLDAWCQVSKCQPDSWVSLPTDWVGIHGLLASTSLPSGLFVLMCALVLLVTFADAS